MRSLLILTIPFPLLSSSSPSIFAPLLFFRCGSHVAMVEGVMQRLDGGGYKDRGDYRCLVPNCGWVGEEVVAATPSKHFASAHPGMVMVTSRLHGSCRKKPRIPVEERKRRDRERAVVYRQGKKVSPHASPSHHHAHFGHHLLLHPLLIAVDHLARSWCSEPTS